MKRSEKVTKNGKFIFERYDESFEFVCDRCLQPKITKIKVTWITPEKIKKYICNGCYGNLLSKEE